jgi:hypothetical protein
MEKITTLYPKRKETHILFKIQYFPLIFEKIFSEIINFFEIVLFLDVKVRGFTNAQMRLKKCKIFTKKCKICDIYK